MSEQPWLVLLRGGLNGFCHLECLVSGSKQSRLIKLPLAHLSTDR